MHANHKCRARQQSRVQTHASNSDAYAFFNLLTGPEFFNAMESLLPTHRERLFPPTETLSMFLAQALSADRSCQRVVNESVCQALGGRIEAVQYAHWGLLPGPRTPAAGTGEHARPRSGQADRGPRATAMALARTSGAAGGWHHGHATRHAAQSA